MSPNRRSLALGLLGAALLPGARALEVPAGPVVLTVRGKLAAPNRKGEAQFDMAMLERLPQRHITTATPWYTQDRKFTGPLVRDVLAAAGANGHTVRALAVNDYRVDIPFDDFRNFDVIVSRLLDDKPMTVREKGPLFVMYPFDTRAELRNAVYFSRCAWQLKVLEVT